MSDSTCEMETVAQKEKGDVSAETSGERITRKQREALIPLLQELCLIIANPYNKGSVKNTLYGPEQL